MVPEKWSTEGRIFCYFGLFFALLPPTNPEKQYLKKWKKTHRDIIILHKCTINNIQMMSSSWDQKCDWQNFLSFWAVFCPFTSLTTKKCQEISFYTSVPNFGHFGLFFATDPPNLKKQNFEKMKKSVEIYHFTLVCNKRQSYDVWFLRNGAQKVEFFVTLDYFWPFYPLPTQKSNIWKNEKKHIEISSFYTSVP